MIYIAAHKAVELPELENYLPLQVGAEGKADLGYLRDDTGQSISEKNPNFCELTGLYWIWKNRSDDYKGLVHYRRYFGTSNLSARAEDIYTYDQMLRLLDGVDVVLPYTEYFKQNAKDELLVSCCTPRIWEQLEHTVKSIHPQFADAFDRFFQNDECSLFNMLFCRRDVFDGYCQWLFSILFALEKQVDLAPLNDYQKRLYGFLAERLLNVWVSGNRLKARHVSVIQMETDLMFRLQLLRRRVTNRVRFKAGEHFRSA